MRADGAQFSAAQSMAESVSQRMKFILFIWSDVAKGFLLMKGHPGREEGPGTLLKVPISLSCCPFSFYFLSVLRQRRWQQEREEREQYVVVFSGCSLPSFLSPFSLSPLAVFSFCFWSNLWWSSRALNLSTLINVHCFYHVLFKLHQTVLVWVFHS